MISATPEFSRLKVFSKYQYKVLSENLIWLVFLRLDTTLPTCISFETDNNKGQVPVIVATLLPVLNMGQVFVFR